MGFWGCSGIRWTTCKLSAPCTLLQTDNNTNTSSLCFYSLMLFLTPNQQCQSNEGQEWQLVQRDRLSGMKCFINKAIVDSRLCPSPVLPMVGQFKYLLQYQILLQHTELLWVYTPCLTFVSPVPSQCVQLQIRPIKPEHTYIRLMTFCPGLPGWAGTRKVKPIWILLKQETVTSAGPYASLYLTPDR